MSTLQVLMLNSNQLDKLSSQVSELEFLRVLYLDGNGIKEVPEGSLGRLTSLEELSMQKNKLK